MRFIDTNIFIRFFTADDEQKAKDVFRLLKRLENGDETAYTSALVIFETVFTLQKYYNVSRNEINELMQSIISIKGLRFELKDTFEEALNLYTSTKLSFTDAFNVCVMKKRSIAEIYSYDEDFDHIPGIKRVIP